MVSHDHLLRVSAEVCMSLARLLIVQILISHSMLDNVKHEVIGQHSQKVVILSFPKLNFKLIMGRVTLVLEMN